MRQHAQTGLIIRIMGRIMGGMMEEPEPVAHLAAILRVTDGMNKVPVGDALIIDCVPADGCPHSSGLEPGDIEHFRRQD